MKFQHILFVSMLALALAACNFSLAEDITPPPGSELVATAPAIATPSAPAATAVPSLVSPTPASSPDTTPTSGVTVTGKVSNGSGGALPSGLTVTLHGILNQQETINLKQPLNPDGSFSFKSVVLANGTEIIAVVPYGPVSFLSEGATYDGTQTSYDQRVAIYESSSELSNLSLDQVHIQASFATTGQIQLNEIYVMTNPGKTAVTVATDGSSLPFASLPDGALQGSIDLSQGSAPLAMADNGFALLPGGQQYAFVVSFNLPYTGNKASLSQPFVLAPASVTIIVPTGVKVEGVGLTDQGANTFQGANFQVYSGGALKAGDSLGLAFSGSPQTAPASGAASGVQRAVLIGLASLGVLLVALGLFFFLRDRRNSLAAVPDEPFEAAGPEDEAVRLADAILALDDRFAAGKINPDDYKQKRAELKEKLKGRL
jgi:hypothetical protein